MCGHCTKSCTGYARSFTTCGGDSGDCNTGCELSCYSVGCYDECDNSCESNRCSEGCTDNDYSDGTCICTGGLRT